MIQRGLVNLEMHLVDNFVIILQMLMMIITDNDPVLVAEVHNDQVTRE